jgi:hypothetical protein
MAALVDLPAPSAPLVLEADHVSLTVAWDKPDARVTISQYELQMTEIDEDGNELGWTSLSNKLKTNQARKKNLSAATNYCFRIRYLKDGGDVASEADWSSFSGRSEAFRVVDDSVVVMDAPKQVSSDSASITISWEALAGVEKYRLRFRQADSVHCK